MKLVSAYDRSLIVTSVACCFVVTVDILSDRETFKENEEMKMGPVMVIIKISKNLMRKLLTMTNQTSQVLQTIMSLKMGM